VSFAGDLSRAIRDVMLYRERIDQLRGAVTGMASDVSALSKDHASLAGRVARIEGFIEGASAAARPKRLPKRAE